MSQTPAASEPLLLDSVDDFIHHTHKLITQARRYITILSDELDPLVYHRDDISEALSAMVRRSRHAQVRILVRHTDGLIEYGHRLTRLVQRLPSKITLRKLTIDPADTRMGFICADRRLLVYRNDEQQAAGFANYNAPAEVKTLLEDFEYCWQRAVQEPKLRLLHL